MKNSNTGKIIAIGAIILAFIGGIIALIIWVSTSTPTTTSISNKPTPSDKGGGPGGGHDDGPNGGHDGGPGGGHDGDDIPTGTCSCPGGIGGIAPMQCKDTPCIKCNGGHAMTDGNICKRQCGGGSDHGHGEVSDRTCKGVPGHNELSTCCSDANGDMRCCGHGCGGRSATCNGE